MPARRGCRACRRRKIANVPPLDYGRVHRLKAAHPDVTIVLNGGIVSVEAALMHLHRLDGVMMGRAAYQEPWRLLDVDPAAVRRGRAVPIAQRPPRRRSSPISSAKPRAARASIPSRATCSACSAACRARARSAAIWRPTARSPARRAGSAARGAGPGRGLACGIGAHRRRVIGAARPGTITAEHKDVRVSRRRAGGGSRSRSSSAAS